MGKNSSGYGDRISALMGARNEDGTFDAEKMKAAGFYPNQGTAKSGGGKGAGGAPGGDIPQNPAPAQPTTPQAGGSDQVAQQRADRIAQFNENLRKARESAAASRGATLAKAGGV